MSCFILTNDHIGYLVNLGHQLDIRGVTIGDNYQSLALHDEHDRRYVTAELLAANRTSVATRYNEQVDPVTDVPTIGNPTMPLINLAQFAQALQWVRCYQYKNARTQTGIPRSLTTTRSGSSPNSSRRSSPASPRRGPTTGHDSPDTATGAVDQPGRRHHQRA